MSNETGGRTDKFGNRFEKNCMIACILDVVSEKIQCCSIENIGKDEIGTDIITIDLEGKSKYIQCKERNGNSNGWTWSSLNKYKIFEKWRIHLDSSNNNYIALQSPLSFIAFEDLIKRANNTNGNPKDFYEFQIKGSGKEIQNSYKKYCEIMKLNINDEGDIAKSISYLKRSKIEQKIDENFKNDILDRISIYFLGDRNIIYNLLLDLIENGNIYAKKIDNIYLNKFFNSNNILRRDLSNDNRIFPTIQKLNDEYKNSYYWIDNKIIERKELDECINEINNGNSIVISGKAGYGKSGVTNQLINYLEEENIVYLAIKLDKKVPTGNAEMWSKELGFSTSVSYCLDCISKNEKAVLILDQLDALRWTNSHSRDSVDICCELLNDIKKINSDRKEKISIVLVCRDYDLENDNGIRKIVNDISRQLNDDHKEKWIRIKIDELEEEKIQNVVGETYRSLNLKLKNLLKVPSNLYIWTKLKEKEDMNDIFTTGTLINKWWKQIEKESTKFDIRIQDLINARDEIVDKMRNFNKISISCRHLKIDNNILDFLHSQEFIIKLENEIISFSHQSILDFYLVENMIDRYLNGEELINLIGTKKQQVPNKRYQVQMFLQELIIEDTGKFVKAVEYIRDNDDIRSYIKYVIYEVLGQVCDIDYNISEFILKNYNDERFINIVFKNHKSYIDFLIKNNVFDKWMKEDKTITKAIVLLGSINNHFDDTEVEFIKKYIGINEQSDNLLYKSFPFDITYDTDKLFEIRMNLYQKYNELADIYVNLDELIKKNEKRAISLVKFWIENEMDKKRNVKYSYNNSIEYSDNTKIVGDENVINMLLPIIPKKKRDQIDLYKWTNGNYHEKSIERICISLIKNATVNLIKNNPDKFLKVFEEYMGQGYVIHNEIILYGLSKLPNRYANTVIKYLFSDIDKNIFEYTSGAKQVITLTKDIIVKFIINVDKKLYEETELKIIEYKPKDMVRIYKYMIQIRKEDKIFYNYSSFWGDLQLELLKVVPERILSKKAQNLLRVLKRKFKNERSTKFDNHYCRSGNVISPLCQKDISDNQWIRILSNKKILTNRKTKFKEETGEFIESNLQEFQSALSNAIQNNQTRFINLLINNKESILKPYILTLYSSLAYCNKLNEISIEPLEKMFQNFSYKQDLCIINYICEIISRKEECNWSNQTIELLIEMYNYIKLNKVPNGTSFNKYDEKDISENMEIYVLNSAIGRYSEAIENILWKCEELFVKFSKSIDEMTKSNDEFVNYASLNILAPCLNIEKEWSITQFIHLYKKNGNLLGYRRTQEILYYCYVNSEKDRKSIVEIIKSNIYNSSERIRKICSYVLAEIYINYGELKELIENIPDDKIVKDSVFEMYTLYFRENLHKEELKPLIINMIKIEKLDSVHIYRILKKDCIDLKDDREFLLQLCDSKNTKKYLRAFIKYVEENAINLLDYKDFIIELAQGCIKEATSRDDYEYEFDLDDLSKIVVKLFDESNGKKNEEATKEKCMDIWDEMFEKNIGSIMNISKDIMNL